MSDQSELQRIIDESNRAVEIAVREASKAAEQAVKDAERALEEARAEAENKRTKAVRKAENETKKAIEQAIIVEKEARKQAKESVKKAREKIVDAIIKKSLKKKREKIPELEKLIKETPLDTVKAFRLSSRRFFEKMDIYYSEINNDNLLVRLRTINDAISFSRAVTNLSHGEAGYFRPAYFKRIDKQLDLEKRSLIRGYEKTQSLIEFSRGVLNKRRVSVHLTFPSPPGKFGESVHEDIYLEYQLNDAEVHVITNLQFPIAPPVESLEGKILFSVRQFHAYKGKVLSDINARLIPKNGDRCSIDNYNFYLDEYDIDYISDNYYADETNLFPIKNKRIDVIDTLNNADPIMAEALGINHEKDESRNGFKFHTKKEAKNHEYFLIPDPLENFRECRSNVCERNDVTKYNVISSVKRKKTTDAETGKRTSYTTFHLTVEVYLKEEEYEAIQEFAYKINALIKAGNKHRPKELYTTPVVFAMYTCSDFYYNIKDKLKQSYNDLFEAFPDIVELKEIPKMGIYDVGVVKLKEDATEQFICSPLIEYVYDDKTNTFMIDFKTSYIINNYRRNACLYTVVLDYWGDQLREHYAKYRNLSYESMYSMIHCKNYNPKTSDFSLSLCELRDKFLRPLKLQLVALDVDCNKIWEYKLDDKSRNKKISPGVLFVIIHNNHVYQCTEPPAVLGQQYGDKYRPHVLIANNVSYKIPNYKAKFGTGFILDDVTEGYNRFGAATADGNIAEGVKKALRLASGKEIDAEGKLIPAQTVKFGVNSAHKVYWYLKNQLKYESVPHISNDTNQIDGMIVKVGKHMVYFKEIIFPEYPGQQFGCEEKYSRFLSYTTNIHSTILNSNNVSYYSPSVMKAMEYYNRAAVCGYFESRSSKFNMAIDLSKAYTSVMLEIQDIPVFTQYDEFTAYDGRLELTSFYIVEITSIPIGIQLTLVNKKIEFLSGYVVNMLTSAEISYKVLYQLTPRKIARNNIAPEIEKLYTQSGLEVQYKKIIVNTLSGMCLKKNSTKSRAHIFSNIDEAGSMRHHVTAFHEYMGNMEIDREGNEQPLPDIDPVEDEGKVMFYGASSETCKLQSGFYFIGHLIYDLSRVKLYKLAVETARFGRVVGVKTDCVFLDARKGTNVKDDINWNLDDGSCKFHTIGSIKFENIEGKKLPDTHIRFNDLTADLMAEHIYKPLPPVINVMSDEYNLDEFAAISAGHPTMLVKALYPGCGKTTSFIRSAVANNKKALLIAPFNNLRQHLKRDGLDCMTLSTVLGEVVGVDKQREPAVDISKYDAVCFDEIFLYTVQNLVKIHRLIRNHSGKVWMMATGDERQNKPIEDGDDYLIKVQWNRDYYVDIINRMFPHQILLKVNKRLREESDKERFYPLYNELYSAEDNNKVLVDILRKYVTFTESMNGMYKLEEVPGRRTTNVVSTNFRAEIVNKYFQDTFKDGRNIQQGDQVVCKKYHKLAGKTNGFAAVNPNIEYTVSKITDAIVTITNDDGKTAELKKSIFDDKFRLPYARTCHSLQGVTGGDYLNVFGVHDNFVDKNWIITALSRCTTLNIRILDH